MSRPARIDIFGILTFRHFLLWAFLVGAAPANAAGEAAGESAPQMEISSVHAGFLYPNGVDVLGYTIEHKINNKFYCYYTFGLPSLAAAGISYYCDYNGNGIAATAGIGIGSVAYGSLVYQIRITDRNFLKLGGGYTTGIAYTGLYPALSYEFRYK
jgi:hypothetical protein